MCDSGINVAWGESKAPVATVRPRSCPSDSMPDSARTTTTVVRFRKPWVVMAGILVATVANHALASSVGVWIAAHVPARVMAGILAATFLVFGIWTLRPDSLDSSEKPSRFGPFVTTAVLFFLAEMGDKTQLATVALAARFQSILSVTVGTTAGMLAADRMRHSSVADQAIALGFATRDQLDALADAFHTWRSHPDAWFTVLHGEILAREDVPVRMCP